MNSGVRWSTVSRPEGPWNPAAGRSLLVARRGYFVRTLGMHRVYNSAFMNMLRDEENAKYRTPT